MSVELVNIRTHSSNIDDDGPEAHEETPLDRELPVMSGSFAALNAAYEPDGVDSKQEQNVLKTLVEKPGVLSFEESLDSVSKSGSTFYIDQTGCWSTSVQKIQQTFSEFFELHGETVKHAFYAILILVYAGYFAWSLNYEFGTESSIRLLWMTMLAVGLIVITLIRDNCGDIIYDRVITPPVDFVKKHFPIFKWFFIACAIAGLLIFLIVDVGLDRPDNLISLAGFAVYILLMFIFSKSPSQVKWRPVLWGLALDFVFALLVIRTTWGYEAFKWLGDRLKEFIDYADEGAIFVFGENFEEHFFAFKALWVVHNAHQLKAIASGAMDCMWRTAVMMITNIIGIWNVLPIIIFFSSCITVLYHLGVMQTVISKIAWLMQRTMGTSAAESTNAVGNIFFGMTEAPLLIRPLVPTMTTSELHAVLVGGFATIAGGVMATYMAIGVSPVHLISASIMAAPCALAISKLFYPELEVSRTDVKNVTKLEKSVYGSVIEAAAGGASAAIPQTANIAANLIAFISILAFINTTLTWMGHRAGLVPPEYPELTFELICSYLLWPFAWLMGVATADCRKVAELIGTKTFLNEFVAYTELSVIISNSEYYSTYNGTVQYTNDDMYLVDANVTLYGGVMEPRSITISTYALCGFANLGAIGMSIGSLGQISPARKHEVARLGVRTMIAGAVVSMINACLAGLLYKEEIF